MSIHNGDNGETFLLNGQRIPKDHPIIEALGCMDELASILCVVIAHEPSHTTKKYLDEITNIHLLHAMALLAAISIEKLFSKHLVSINHATDQLEQWVKEYESSYSLPNCWLRPTSNKTAAFLEMARTICRRAERQIVKVVNQGHKRLLPLIKYLNRLSYFLWLTMIAEEKQTKK